jgi:hypothetical protein
MLQGPDLGLDHSSHTEQPLETRPQPAVVETSLSMGREFTDEHAKKNRSGQTSYWVLQRIPRFQFTVKVHADQWMVSGDNDVATTHDSR